MPKVRIIIVDDQKLMLDLLSLQLENIPEFEVVGTALGEKGMLDLLQAQAVDLVLLDVELPASSGKDGFQLAELLRRDYPTLKIVSISFNTRTATLHRLLEEIGVDGFIDKNDTSVHHLVQAIQMVMGGGIYTSPNLKSRVEHALEITSLSPKEYEVMKLIALGQTNKQIAQTLDRSIKTIEIHRTRILQKLKCHNTAEATAVFLKHFFLHQDDPESLPNFKKLIQNQ